MILSNFFNFFKHFFLFRIRLNMRKKLKEEEKKQTVSFTINPYINELLEKHLKESGINKSKFIETVLEQELKKNKK